jgi:Guanine nucleotide exchange factor synembryn
MILGERQAFSDKTTSPSRRPAVSWRETGLVETRSMNSPLPAARRWLEQLAEDVENDHFTQPRRDEILGQLKFLGREVDVVRALYDVSGIKTLGHYAFGDYPRSTSREALRCIANALLLVPATQQTFLELGFVPKTAEAYKLQDNLDEFPVARVLFLMTYNKSTDFQTLIEEHDLATSVTTHIKRHADTPPLVPRTDVDAVTAILETVKLLFNVTNVVPQLSCRFNPAVPWLLEVVIRTPLPIGGPLQGGTPYTINALANLEFRDQPSDELDPEISKRLNRAIDKLLSTLEMSLQSYTEKELDTRAIALLTVLRKIYEVADDTIRRKMKAELLPKDSERNVPLGQSSTLASRLLRLTTAAGQVNIPQVVSSFLFELSDKDASTFVKNVGYGYAAGYLMSHQIPIPENAKTPGPDYNQVPINPITGQRLDKEEDVSIPEMTQGEKEREAERLYVLFERLKATGVVDVKNPVHQAREEGRFEEVDDSGSDLG